MNRPSARAARRTAADLSDQLTPHLSHAKDTLVEDVLPKMKSTGVDLAVRAAPHVSSAKDTFVGEVLPKVKATGAGLGVRAGLMSPPKKRHPLRMAAIVGVIGVGAYAAWNAWRLPHESDDWAHADGAAGPVRTDDRPQSTVPVVPADSTPGAF